MSLRSTPPPKTETDRRLLQAALLLSVASAAFSAYSAFGRAPSTPAAGDASSLRSEMTELRKALDTKADTGQLAASIQRLHTRLDVLEARLRQGPSTARDDDDPASPAASAAPPSPASTGAARSAFNGPRFVELQPPAKGIAVKQLEDGSLSVTNTDPALTGRTMLVKGKAADGSERDIAITVPPP